MPQLGVQVIGSNLGLRATLDESVAAANTWADLMIAAGDRAGQGITAAIGEADASQVALRDSYAKSVEAAGVWSSETLAAAVRSARALELTGTAAMQAEVAYGKLGMAVSRYGAGTIGEAQAVARYTATVEGLYQKQIMAADSAAAAQERAALKVEGATRSIGRTMSTYVTLPLAAAGYEAIKLGTEFQASMTRIETYAGASATEVAKQQAAILNNAGVLPQGPVQASEALFHLESIGLRGPRALETLKASALAAGAGMADLTSSTTALGGALVADIKGASDARTAMAGLITIAGEGNMTMQDLTDALGTGLLVKASDLGISLREVGSALATLVDRGIPARRAATYLGTTFALMYAPSKEASNALADMGINAEKMKTTLRQPNGLLAVLEMLKEGVDRVGKARGMADLMAAFGRSRQSTGILTLIESLDARVSNYTQKLAQYDAGVQHAQQRMTAYQQTAQYKLHTALSQIEADFIKIGIQIAPGVADAVHKIADGISAVVNVFDQLPKPEKEALGYLAMMLAVGGPILVGTAFLLKAMREVRTSFFGVRTAATTSLTTVDGELATTGTSAEAATTKVAALRSALLGLAGLVVVATVEIQVLDYFKNKLLAAQQEAIKAGANAPQYGDLFKHVAAEITADKAKGMSSKEIATKIYAQYGGQGAGQEKLLAEAYEYLAYERTGKATGYLEAYLKEQAKLAAAKAAKERPKSAGTGAHGPTPFSHEQQIQLGLLADPNSARLMREQIDYDNEALARLKRLREEGRINNIQYLNEVQAIYQDRNSWMSKLNSLDHKNATKAAKAWEPPANLQIALAKAEAAVAARMAAKGVPFSATMLRRAQQSDPAVRSAEEAEKRWILAKIHSGTLSAKAEIAAYNELTKLNKALAEATAGSSTLLGPYHIASLSKLTRGITDPAVRKQVEARIAEAQMFSGHVPYGTHGTYITHTKHGHVPYSHLGRGVHAPNDLNVAAGHAQHITFTGPITIKGVQNVRQLVAELERYGFRGSVQRRGANAGTYPGR